MVFDLYKWHKLLLNPILFDILLGILLGTMVITITIKSLLIIIAIIGLLTMIALPKGPFYASIATVPIWMPIGEKLSIARVVLISALLISFFNASIRRGPWLAVFDKPAGFLGLIFAFIIFLTILLAQEPLRAAIKAGYWGIMLIYFFITLTYVNTLQDVKNIIIFLTCIGVFEALVVVCQAHFGLIVPVGGLADHIKEWQAGARRYMGTTAHPVVLAGFLQVTIAFAVALTITAKNNFYRVISLLSVVLMCYAWWYTFSRSSSIAIVAMLVAAVLANSRISRFFAVIFIFLAYFVLFSYDFSLSALVKDIETHASLLGAMERGSGGLPGFESLQWRLEQWTAGWHMFMDYFMMGVGPGRSVDLVSSYMPSWSNHLAVTSAEIHNTFLHVATETGIFGILIYSSIWIWGFISLKHAAKSKELEFYAILIIVVLVGQVTLNFFNPTMREPFFVLALAASLGRIARSQKK